MTALYRIKKNIFTWIIVCFISVIILLFVKKNDKPSEYVLISFSLICLVPTVFNVMRFIKFNKQIKTNKEYEGIIINHVRVFKRSSYLTIKSNDKEIDTHTLYDSFYSNKYVGKKVKYVLIDRVAVITEEIKEEGTYDK